MEPSLVSFNIIRGRRRSAEAGKVEKRPQNSDIIFFYKTQACDMSFLRLKWSLNHMEPSLVSFNIIRGRRRSAEAGKVEKRPQNGNIIFFSQTLACDMSFHRKKWSLNPMEPSLLSFNIIRGRWRSAEAGKVEKWPQNSNITFFIQDTGM